MGLRPQCHQEKWELLLRGKEQRPGDIPPAPSSVFQVVWELPLGLPGAGPHAPAPPFLWISRSPTHPKRAAVNWDAWEQWGGRV